MDKNPPIFGQKQGQASTLTGTRVDQAPFSKTLVITWSQADERSKITTLQKPSLPTFEQTDKRRTELFF